MPRGASCSLCRLCHCAERPHFVELLPCSHRLCARCFHRSTATNNKIICPTCNQRPSSSAFLAISSSGSVVKDDEICHPEIVDLKQNPVPQIDPVRQWIKEGQAKPQSGIIYVAFNNPSGGGTTFYESRFCLDKDKTVLTEESKSNLVKIFARIFNPLLFNDELSDKEAGLPDAADCEQLDFINAVYKDSSLALRCLHALCTGRTLDSEQLAKVRTDGNSEEQSLLRAIFVAKELLMYPDSRQRKVSRWQKFVTDTLYAHMNRGTTKLLEMFSKFRVSASTTFHGKQLDYRSMKALEEDAEVMKDSKWCLFAWVLDNLDFKIMGAKPGNDAFVITARHMTDEDALKRVGFYSEDPTKRISRERRTLASITRDEDGEIQQDGDDRIVTAGDHEWKSFSFIIMRRIQSIMEKKLPPLAIIDRMIDEDVFTDWDNYDSLPRNFGIDFSLPTEPNVVDGKRVRRMPKPSDDGIADDAIPEEEEIEDAEDVIGTLISNNNTTILLPVRSNLVKNDVVQQHMHSVLDSVEAMLEDEIPQPEIDAHGGERPVQELMAPFIGDNSPVSACSKLIDLATEQGRGEEFERLTPFLGCFHWTIELPDRRCHTVYSIIKFFTETCRKTESGLKHVLRPRDPKQAAQEAPHYIAAFYRAAGEACSQSTGGVEVSPADVHDHMLNRSKDYALALAILQDLRFMEVFCLFEAIERTQSADLLIAALRVVLPFLMVLNAHKCIRSTVDMLVWWETTSEAERILFEQFILAKRTANGKPIFLDRLQEKLNLVFRSKLGDKSLPGMQRQIRKVALGTHEIESQRRGLTGFRRRQTAPTSEPKTESVARCHRVFAHVYSKVKAMNLWGPGAPLIGPKNDLREAVPDLLECPAEKVATGRLDASILKAHQVGRDRATEYLRVFYLEENRRIPTRPVTDKNDGVPIATTWLSREQLSQQIKYTKVIKTSRSAAEIKKAVKHMKGEKKEPLRREIEAIATEWRSMRRHWKERIRDVADNIDDLSELLAALRKDFFDVKPKKREELEAEIGSMHSHLSECTRDEREEVVADALFSLDETIVLSFNEKITLL